MANIRYFVDLVDAEPLLFKLADYDKGARHMPRAYHHERGWLRVTRVVEFKRQPSLHRCDARCQHARGRLCECSCGGKNHGVGERYSALGDLFGA